jgi:hypothetical protein
MKGIYLSEEGKKAIEDRIAEIERKVLDDPNPFTNTHSNSMLLVYKEILSSAMILPVVESWESVSDYITSIEQSYFPNGVIIIQSKQ